MQATEQVSGEQHAAKDKASGILCCVITETAAKSALCKLGTQCAQRCRSCLDRYYLCVRKFHTVLAQYCQLCISPARGCEAELGLHCTQTSLPEGTAETLDCHPLFEKLNPEVIEVPKMSRGYHRSRSVGFGLPFREGATLVKMMPVHGGQQSLVE